MEIFATCCSIASFLVAITTIITFLKSQKKAIETNTASRTEMTTMLNYDIRYIKDSLDSIQLELKDIQRQQNTNDIDIVKLNDKVNNLDSRLKTIETKVEKYHE